MNKFISLFLCRVRGQDMLLLIQQGREAHHKILSLQLHVFNSHFHSSVPHGNSALVPSGQTAGLWLCHEVRKEAALLWEAFRKPSSPLQQHEPWLRMPAAPRWDLLNDFLRDERKWNYLQGADKTSASSLAATARKRHKHETCIFGVLWACVVVALMWGRCWCMNTWLQVNKINTVNHPILTFCLAHGMGTRKLTVKSPSCCVNICIPPLEEGEVD